MMQFLIKWCHVDGQYYSFFSLAGKPAVGWNKGFALAAHHSKLHNQSERTPSVDTPPLWQALLLQKVALARNVVNAFRISHCTLIYNSYLIG